MLVVDRIANGLVVCVNEGSVLNIPMDDISGVVREGDVLRWDEVRSKYMADTEDTKERLNSISERFMRIKNRNRKRS